jgi:hypothetical protein
MSGWGCSLAGEAAFGRRWNPSDLADGSSSINFLELRAIEEALHHLQSELAGKVVLIESDNVSAVSYLVKLGGLKAPHLNAVARRIWVWCLGRGIWVTGRHICW